MKINGSKILVTGGAGFIGSHIVERLVRAGAQVCVYDNFSSGFESNLDPVKKDIKIIKGDILDPPLLKKAASKMDAICHHAAQLEIIRCIETPLADLKCNTEGTINILEAARQCGISKVIYASSACVYGQAHYTPQDERHPTAPNWPYGVSKLATEQYARLYQEYYHIETVGLRYSIVYGPREWYGRVLTAFLKRALDNLPPVIWGGHQLRDFIHVSDVVAMNMLCLENDFPNADIFNVSTGIGTSIRDLAFLVSEMFSLLEPILENIREGETSKHVAGRIRLPAELGKMVLSSEKANKILGWKPEVPIRKGIKDEMEWLTGNRDRWQVMHY